MKYLLFFRRLAGEGEDDAGVGIQRLKGTCFALVLPSLQLKDVCGSFEGGKAWGNAKSSHPYQQQRRQRGTRDDGFFSPHQPEELTATSVLLSFPAGSVFRLHCALEDPQNPPFTLSTGTGASLEVATVLPLSGAAVTSILLW